VALSSMFVATLSFTGLVLLGVPYAFAHAVLAGLFNFIPNLGPTLSAVFPVFVALLQSPGKALAVVALYVLIQNLESYWFSPMVMQKQVSLLPAATLISQIFFATFFGPVGLILALPLAVICKTWIEEAWIIDVLDRGEDKDGKEIDSERQYERTPSLSNEIILPQDKC
ncbi:MAG: AI-2E family transporter, partial [Nodosilinea sp.]